MLIELPDDALGVCPGEICKICYNELSVGFSVPDEIWEVVVPNHLHDNVVCLNCFTRLADAKLVEWDKQIEFYPCSLVAKLHTHAALTLQDMEKAPFTTNIINDKIARGQSQ